MFKKLLVAAASSTIVLSAFAVDASRVEKSVELKDGSMVHIFADGKMGMEDKFGRPGYMELGHVMETQNGEKIVMIGNEVARLDRLFNKYQSGGRLEAGHVMETTDGKTVYQYLPGVRSGN